MTAGHKHRTIKVREDSLLRRVLTGPTLYIATARTAEASRFVYGPTEDPDLWRLSPLGLLHALFGLTLEIVPNNGDGDDFAGEDPGD